MTYHFGDAPVTVTLPVPAGAYRRVLASSEARFGGGEAGPVAPEEIRSDGLARVTLGPCEAALYVRAH